MAPQTGTVVHFRRRNGFGFIQPEGTKDKSDQIFVHWKQISTDDKWPALEKDQVVQYVLAELEGKKQATKVTLEDGEKVSVDFDSNKKHSKKKHKGTVKFFDNRKGFGFIIPEKDELEFGGHKMEDGKGLYFEREDLICEDDTGVTDKTDIQFQLYYKEDKDGLCAGKITQPNGSKIEFESKRKDLTPEEIEELQAKRKERQQKKRKKNKKGWKKNKKSKKD